MVRRCVADFEANGLLDTVDTIWCAVFKDIDTGEVFAFSPQETNWIQKCKSFMDNCSFLAIHNGIGYDETLLKKVWDYDFKGEIFDTLIVSRLHEPKRKAPKNYRGKGGPHSVEAWGCRFGVPKPEHEDWTQFSEDMLHRCKVDVEIQTLIFEALKEEAKGLNWDSAYKMTFQLFRILYKQGEYGWEVDVPYMKRCIRQLTTWIERLDRMITPQLPMLVVIEESKSNGKINFIKKPFLKSGKYSSNVLHWLESAGYSTDHSPAHRIVSGPFSRVSFRHTNLNSPQETKEFLLSQGWEPKKWNYKKDPKTGWFLKDTKGQPIKTSPVLDSNDPFKGVLGKVGKACAKRVTLRYKRSTLEGWLKSVRCDGRISARVTNFTETYRMIHSGIVNVPGEGKFYGKQMRKCFIAKKGFTLIGTDSKSCQDRMLAERSRMREFTNMLLNGVKSLGTDGHSLAMKAVNKVLGPLGLPLIKRGVGKNFNFAWKFGARDKKLGDMVNSGETTGKKIRVALEETFPAQAALVKRLTEEWASNAKRRQNKWGKTELYDGWITGLDGRPVTIAHEYMILVYVLQSDEAIYMSAVYCNIYKELNKKYKWGKDYGIVCFYHDEVTVEIREEYAEEASEIIERCFKEVSHYFNMDHCPQEGEASIGKNWYEIH